jgi:perosamine synthetase
MSFDGKLAIDGGSKVRTTPLPSQKDLGDEEIALLTEVIRSGKLNRGVGDKVATFEKEFAKFYNVKYGVASTSGTAAIHVAVGALNLDPGSEIITAPVTDMGTIIPILFQNCIPIFADLEPDTYNLDPKSIEERITDKTKAIIAVHLTGAPCDMDAIMALAEKYNLYVIEDCSQAYLTKYKGRLVGTIGHMGTFSLQQSKHITTGDGGITITNDDNLGERATLFANKGWPHYGRGGRDYVCFGNNYRMTELQAAVALAQLKKLPKLVERRVNVGLRITEGLKKIKGVKPPIPGEGNVNTYWFYLTKIDEDYFGVSTAQFAKALTAEGISTGAGYIGKPIYEYDLLKNMKIYGDSGCPFNCPLYGKEVKYERGICPQTEENLPKLMQVRISEFFTDEDADDVIKAFEKVANYYAKANGKA